RRPLALRRVTAFPPLPPVMPSPFAMTCEGRLPLLRTTPPSLTTVAPLSIECPHWLTRLAFASGLSRSFFRVPSALRLLIAPPGAHFGGCPVAVLSLHLGGRLSGFAKQETGSQSRSRRA